MKGAVIAEANGQPSVTDSLTKPKPATNQVLVKSLWVAMNPVDGYMATGLLVEEWPLVLSVDASGIIVEAGTEAQSKYKLNVGDYVCGCTRLGMQQYAAGQEYFLMDAHVVIPKPTNIDVIQAATLGVGIETAALCVYEGLKVELPKIDQPTKPKDEWAIVLGGASSVGWYAIQLLQVAGYKVLASCSAKSADAVKALDVEVFDYKESIDKQLEKIVSITGGVVSRVVDAVASDGPAIAKELFKHDSLSDKTKCFATTNDWSGVGDFEGGKTYVVQLGPIGRPGSTELDRLLTSYIPTLVGLVQTGKVKVGDYEIVGDGGFEDIVKAYKQKQGGASGLKKLVVKVQDE